MLGDQGLGEDAALLAETTTHEREVFAYGGATPGFRRLTDSNPWLGNVALADQRAVQWKARDGLGLEGILIEPLHDDLGDPPPLLIVAHGGPEGHFRNGWNSSYSRPGQLAAAQGFAVFFGIMPPMPTKTRYTYYGDVQNVSTTMIPQSPLSTFS